MILEVMDGDFLIIPSAAITHRNSGLKAHEWRSSVVQYTGGGMFRWIWQGCKLSGKKNFSAEEKRRRGAEGDKRWLDMIDVFPNLDRLKLGRKSGLLPKSGALEKIKEGLSHILPANT